MNGVREYWVYSAGATRRPRWPWPPPPRFERIAMALATSFLRSRVRLAYVGVPWMHVKAGWGKVKGVVDVDMVVV